MEILIGAAAEEAGPASWPELAWAGLKAGLGP